MTNDICDVIENDDFYREFLSEGKPKELDHLNSTTSISDQIKKLADGVELLSNELQSQVRQQHGALLSQASHASKLSLAVDAVKSHMAQLEAGADRLKAQINGPYGMLENQTRVLARLHDASHLLRQTVRFLQLFRKLQAAAKNLPVQATILFEMEPLLEDQQLSCVEYIADERTAAVTAKQKLNNLANRDLMNGLKSVNETNEKKVINSLQIYANLQTLPKCIDQLIENYISDIQHSIKECFTGTEVSKLSSKKTKSEKQSDSRGNRSRGPGKTPLLTTSQHFRTKLWQAIDWLFDEEIYNYWTQIIFLEKCLEKIHQAPASSELFQKSQIKQRFWNNLEDLLRKSFVNCTTHVNQCLKQDLPKLLNAARTFQSKISNKFTFSESVFENLDAGYLEKCALNLKAPLAGTDMPTQAAVDSFIQAGQIELSAALIDDRLSLLVAAAFTACNKDFWTKIEAHIKLGTDSKQVVDVPNVSQIQNTTLANTVYYHNLMVKRMIQNLGNNFATSLAAQKITESLNIGTKLVANILNQLTESIKSTANIILLSMHREPGLNSDRTISSGPSLYMKELQDFLQRTWNLHISCFNDKLTTRSCGKEIAERCIELFTRNIAIIRPISASGRNRLKFDCQHMETVLSPIVGDLTQLGRSFRQLRSLASLITMSPDELSKQTIDSDSPVSPFIILLLHFAHAGQDLTSPHIAAGWSNEKVILWLDDHTSNKERFELITGALQKYRTIVRQKNIVQYDPVYPFISNLLDKVSKSFNQK